MDTFIKDTFIKDTFIEDIKEVAIIEEHGIIFG